MNLVQHIIIAMPEIVYFVIGQNVIYFNWVNKPKIRNMKIQTLTWIWH